MGTGAQKFRGARTMHVNRWSGAYFSGVPFPYVLVEAANILITKPRVPGNEIVFSSR